MNSPATIVGTALIASTTVRTTRASVPRTSLRYTAVAMPSGTLSSIEIATCSRVPIIAAKMPPWLSGASGPMNAVVSV